jgi:hypothetical protein
MLVGTRGERQRHVRRISARRLTLAWLAILVVAAGCNLREDATLYVSNHSGATWYLAVDSKDGMHFVSKVADGAEGFALVWESHGDRSVSVLNKSCEVVGTFQIQPDGSYALPAVPGLTATIEARRTTGSYVDGVELTTDCGGGYYL